MFKSIFTLSLLFISAPSLGNYVFEPSKYNCQGIEKRIDNINSKMRAGYSSREGERLKEELRQLKKQRNSCKSKGFSVH